MASSQAATGLLQQLNPPDDSSPDITTSSRLDVEMDGQLPFPSLPSPPQEGPVPPDNSSSLHAQMSQQAGDNESPVTISTIDPPLDVAQPPLMEGPPVNSDVIGESMNTSGDRPLEQDATLNIATQEDQDQAHVQVQDQQQTTTIERGAVAQTDIIAAAEPQAGIPQTTEVNVPEWVTWQDDPSVPDEEELREITGTEDDKSALDVPYIEQKVFPQVHDPEQRPIKKFRMSWIIKGLRGTKERPNYARSLSSPCALVDGYYWQIKFYPRGNTSTSLSAYIRCTKHEPKETVPFPEGSFRYFVGCPDADIGEEAEPKHSLTLPDPATTSQTAPDVDHGTDSSDVSKSLDPSVTANQSKTAVQSNGGVEMSDNSNQESADEDDYRISAQLGMVIYNPTEPRTGTYRSSEHQFSKANDDWGWTDYVGPWNEIHYRQRGQRKALLQNDTLAIDAYIRIFEDPSEALWWHQSHDHEQQWPSKKLTGYLPMGTPPLYHSPAVAGITAYLLLAPFRKVIENVDAGKWRVNSQTKPQPLLCLLQAVLDQMRNLKDNDYVNVHYVIDAMKDFGEVYRDVKSFWEAFSRSVKLELANEDDAREQISQIFDTSSGEFNIPTIPIRGVEDVQQSVNSMASNSEWSGPTPDVLPMMLKRQYFDEVTREWALDHQRLVMNDEILVPQSLDSDDVCGYTLFGFMVHVGERTSEKFYSILRPNGPGSKWLAFEDGDGNKIHSYTKYRVRDFEGLDAKYLKQFKGTRQTAYMVIYIKTDSFREYLPGQLEPYSMPAWVKSSLSGPQLLAEPATTSETGLKGDVDVEVYHDEALVSRRGLLDMFNVKQQSTARDNFRRLSLPPKTTFREVRQTLAAMMGVDNVKKIRLFVVSYGAVGQYTSAQWLPAKLEDTLDTQTPIVGPLCMWTALLKNEEDVNMFGVPDPVVEQESKMIDDQQSASERNGGASLTDVEQSEVTQDTVVDTSQDSDEPGSDPVSQPTVSDLTSVTPNVLPTNPTTTDASAFPALHGQDNTTPIMDESTDAPAVEHGHLVDAIMTDPPSRMENIDAAAAAVIDEVIALAMTTQTLLEQTEDTSNNDTIIASLLAMDAEASEVIAETRPTEAEDALVHFEILPPVPSTRNVYGFLQVFDVEKQNFYVHSTFFAKRDERVKPAVRCLLGYDADKEFIAWHRETDLDGVTIDNHVTFGDINFSDGVDMIVGEVLSESQIEELQREGKFASPFSLTRYLRMLERGHPNLAKTSIEPVVIEDFGSEYYRGPLVNGQAHGEKCYQIMAGGQSYEGPLICGVRSGTGGKMIHQNGDIYEGAWLKNERHGQGTFIEKRTGNKYTGGFMNGKRWGKGTTTWQVADEEADMCQICYGEEIDALFFDCGHVCACMECARQCPTCPICRRTVRQVVKMFWT